MTRIFYLIFAVIKIIQHTKSRNRAYGKRHNYSSLFGVGARVFQGINVLLNRYESNTKRRIFDFQVFANGNAESHMFFCEPCSPHEKAEIEKNHTLFRDIVKTGTSFDDFTQETVNLIFSHVNAVKRKQFIGKSAYDMFSFYCSEILASALGISFIPANKVIQSPKLLTKILS